MKFFKGGIAADQIIVPQLTALAIIDSY
jgi:hypothetical protein